MTDEQINAAIAEAIDADPHWKCAKDYCDDLNAMHEAEKVLTDDQYMHFSDCLYDAEHERRKQTKKWRWLSATARQRAEAFLRTLGKWEEVQK